MAIYSNSRLSTYEQCPLRFKYHYIDKLEAEIEDTIEAFLGKRVHEALEKLYNDLKFQKLNELSSLLDFFNDEWKKNWNESILIVRHEYSQENFRKMGEKFITDFYNRYFPFNQSRTIALETEKTVNLDSENKYSIHIRIDRLTLSGDNTYEIHDYKTSNRLLTQDEIDNDRQLAVYAYGIKKMYPDAKRIRLIWHFLAFDKEMSSERTDEQLENLKKDVLELIREIESRKDFPAKESALCGWCEFKQLCPNFKHLYKIEEKSAEEFLNDNGVSLVNKYAEVYEQLKHMEAELEKLRGDLIAYTKKEGIEKVYGSDVKASVKKFFSMKFPGKHDENRGEFAETIKTLGLWDRLAIVDGYELAKMLNNNELHEDFVSLLEKFIRKEENYRVSLRKK